ncbi:hypothetical protein [Naasia sp. SYSU D00057]|uniref:DUF7882 family protein n=1 Tax=Naasia sp. SYSU D00057 TaxID=2817380 RepID=UPI001B3184C9|nr:hypothetical protein [Naasia sp. SYSU D00057]
MGRLRYGDSTFEFEDRLLAHLQIVISTKLRRGEHFLLSWSGSRDSGEGRDALWIDNGIPMHFHFSGGRPPAINRDWLVALLDASNSSGGLVVTPESTAPPTPR